MRSAAHAFPLAYARLRSLVVPLSAMAWLACGGGDLIVPSNEPAQIEVVEGDEQIGTAGLPLEQPVVVRLVDEAGIGIPKRAVTWVVSAGGGSATPQTSITDENGVAFATWILGPAPGPNRLEAVVSDVGLVTFNALAAEQGGGGGGGGAPVPSPTQSTVAVDPAAIPAGTGTATITVVVRDENGNPIEGANVVLHATGEGNSLTQPRRTGATGIATATLTSTVPGTKVITATVGSVQLVQTGQVTVTAPTLRMELLAGNNQTAPAGSAVSTHPAVKVTNDAGQPVAGVPVTFVVTGGGGAVSGATVSTDSEGIARVGSWTLGASPGQNTLEARAESVPGSPVIFSAQGTGGTGGGSVHHFVFRVQPRDVQAGESFSVEVAMVDAAGNLVPLSGIEIYLGLFTDGSNSPSNTRLQGDRFRQTENGIAVFTLAVSQRGRYRLRALSDELPSLGPHGPEPYLFSNPFTVR